MELSCYLVEFSKQKSPEPGEKYNPGEIVAKDKRVKREKMSEKYLPPYKIIEKGSGKYEEFIGNWEWSPKKKDEPP